MLVGNVQSWLDKISASLSLKLCIFFIKYTILKIYK
jgi:hypothetical protein